MHAETKEQIKPNRIGQLSILLFPLLLVFYEMAVYFSNDMYLPALPTMAQELALSTRQAQLTLTAWFLGASAMPLIAGVLTDRFGRRPILLTGGVIYILASIFCALTTSAEGLLIARFIQGAMVCSATVAGYACIHEIYEQKQAIRILAIMGSLIIIAPGFGPFFGSLLLNFFGWRGIFWFVGLWALLNVLLLAKWMPESLPSTQRKPINLIHLFKHYYAILTNKKFIIFLLLLSLHLGGFFVWLTASPFLIIENFHYSAIAYGLIQALIFIASIIGSRLVKYLLERLPIDRLLHLGIGTSLLGGLLACCFAWLTPQFLPGLCLAMMIYSLGSGMTFAPLNRVIVESSNEPMGMRVSMLSVLTSGSAVLMSAITSLCFNGTMLSFALLLGGIITLAYLIKQSVEV